MVNNRIKSPKQALNPAFLKQKPIRAEIELFKKEYISLLDRINEKESEEFHKNLMKDFLNAVYYKDKHYINTRGRADLVIHNGKDTNSPVGVLIETKSPINKAEMVSRENLNVKSFQELVLYYLRERKTGKNFELRYLIITNIYEWFVFDAQDFEKLFYQNKKLLKDFEQFENKKLAGTSTDFFYKEIASRAIARLSCHSDESQNLPKQQEIASQARNDSGIPYTYFDIRDYEQVVRSADKEADKQLIALYQFLSPNYLLKIPFEQDANSLNTEFYAELLHILGLEEVKRGGQKFIERKKTGERDNGSILENAIVHIERLNKAKNEQEQYDFAFDLSITWINRILFLKLLESQILKYHNQDKSYAFLSPERLNRYNDLEELFFSVLAKKENERSESVKSKFAKVPYLNSSLFEVTETESKTISISNLKDDAEIALYSKSVLNVHRRDAACHVSTRLRPLEYLLRFLDAYDFSSEGGEEILDENKALISASVLGLIFEKINGYKDGSFFTPSFITMYMCRETISRAVIQKFNEAKSWNCQTVNDLYNKISDIKEANTIFNSLRICDPAVGSGHFLVSALNEMIRLKSELGILADKEGKRLKNYHITIENDELIVTDEDGNAFQYNPKNAESQRVQATLFHEKQTMIENCLFGVDINPNSVKICQLRLWIELLKNTYYRFGTNELETLPNIDINIKCGNSLMSRFGLDDKNADLSPNAKQKIAQATQKYKEFVPLYKACDDKNTRHQIVSQINQIRDFYLQINNAKDADYQELKKLQYELGERTFGTFADFQTEEWREKTAELTEKVQKLETQYNEKIRGCFEWRFEFPEVLDDDGNFVGFDVVIGNPPYMIVFDMMLKKEYERNFPEFIRNNDLYVAFINRGLSLLKEKGLFCLITPNTYLKGDYFKSLRKFLQQYQILEIVDFGIKQVFTEANVFTAIFLLKKDTSQEKWILKSDFSDIKGHINSNELDFVLKNPLIQKLDKLAKLDDFAKIKDCGYNYWSIGKGKVRQNSVGSRILYSSENKENELDIPYYKGSNIQKYSLSEPKQFLRHNYSDFLNKNDVFRFSANLLEHKPKIIYRQTSSSLIATLDENGFHNDKTVHIIIPNDSFDIRFILGLFNSKLINYYYQQINSEQGRTFAQVKTVYVKQLPIPKVSKDEQQPIIALVNQILSVKKENAQADTKKLEREIDKLVYGLYGLSEEEVKIIEK